MKLTKTLENTKSFETFPVLQNYCCENGYARKSDLQSQWHHHELTLSSLTEMEKSILKFICEAQKILSSQRNHQLIKPAGGFQTT
jgi:hypothetical protein